MKCVRGSAQCHVHLVTKLIILMYIISKHIPSHIMYTITDTLKTIIKQDNSTHSTTKCLKNTLLFSFLNVPNFKSNVSLSKWLVHIMYTITPKIKQNRIITHTTGQSSYKQILSSFPIVNIISNGSLSSYSLFPT